MTTPNKLPPVVSDTERSRDRDVNLLTYKLAGDRLGCSERTVWQLVRDGLIPAVRIGKLVRIDPADLATFIQRAKNVQQTPGAKALAATLAKLTPAERAKAERLIADRKVKVSG